LIGFSTLRIFLSRSIYNDTELKIDLSGNLQFFKMIDITIFLSHSYIFTNPVLLKITALVLPRTKLCSLPCFNLFFAWLNFLPWRWRRHMLLKRWVNFFWLEGIVSHKVTLFITTSLGTWSAGCLVCVHF
jgi:hypothetical protein